MTIPTFMLNIIERLSMVFTYDSYQSRLEEYLNTKRITDAATLEFYMKEFDLNIRSNYGVINHG